MPDPFRFRTRSSLAVLVPLLLTLGVTAALAWRAWESRREHRRAAEETVRDYATFAATIAASNVEAAMDRVLLYAFYGADLAERQASDEPVPPEVLATNPPEEGRCASHYPGGRWFARVAPDGRVDVEGPMRPELAGWIADTLVALQRVRASPRHGNLFPALGSGPAVAYRLRRNAAGDAVEAHALAHCFESPEGPVFVEARGRTPLLPPTVPAGTDASVELSVTDPRGRTVFGTPPAAGSAFVGVRPPDEAGPLGGLVFSVAIPDSVAQALVAGGIPGDDPGGLWLLLLLAGALGAATLIQVHRSLALVRARERFVANVSHELRTPLQLLLLFAQLLRMDKAGSEREREEALEIIERETRRLAGLVERVLSFTRNGPARGRGTRSMQRGVEGGAEAVGGGAGVVGGGADAFGGGADALGGGADALGGGADALGGGADAFGGGADVAVVTRETVEAFRLLANEKSVRLALELPAHLPPVRAGPDAVRQILLNLLDNAVRYGPPGQRVVVRAAVENGAVRLTVEDEGPGIPTRDRERVWRPFHRLEPDGGPERSGSGIGLAVVREAVEAAGGRAWIEDAGGRAWIEDAGGPATGAAGGRASDEDAASDSAGPSGPSGARVVVRLPLAADRGRGE